MDQDVTRAHEARDRYGCADFRLGRHLVQTLGLAGVIAIGGVWLAYDAPWWVWLWSPGFWVIANAVEWAVHRYSMHQPSFPPSMYRNHAIWHHSSFRHESMGIRDTSDLSLVMMPWYTLLIVFTMVTPIVSVIGFAFGYALAGVFLTSAVGYFLFYEGLHTAYHVDPRHLQRLPGPLAPLLTWLSAHHAHHHRPERMRSVNFNVTLPLADACFRTYESSAESSP